MLGDNLSSLVPSQKSLYKVQPDRERGGGGEGSFSKSTYM